MIADLEGGHAGTHRIDDAHPFVAEDGSGKACGYVALQDVQVGAADPCLGDPDDGVAGPLNDRLQAVLETSLARAVIDEGLHGVACFQ